MSAGCFPGSTTAWPALPLSTDILPLPWRGLWLCIRTSWKKQVSGSIQVWGGWHYLLYWHRPGGVFCHIWYNADLAVFCPNISAALGFLGYLRLSCLSVCEAFVPFSRQLWSTGSRNSKYHCTWCWTFHFSSFIDIGLSQFIDDYIYK